MRPCRLAIILCLSIGVALAASGSSKLKAYLEERVRDWTPRRARFAHQPDGRVEGRPEACATTPIKRALGRTAQPADGARATPPTPGSNLCVKNILATIQVRL